MEIKSEEITKFTDFRPFKLFCFLLNALKKSKTRKNCKKYFTKILIFSRQIKVLHDDNVLSRQPPWQAIDASCEEPDEHPEKLAFSDKTLTMCFLFILFVL